MSHTRRTPKDSPAVIDPETMGYRAAHYAPPIDHAERARVEAEWVAVCERMKAAQPRRVANVRAASTAARWAVLVGGVILALLAVVSGAYVAAEVWR